VGKIVGVINLIGRVANNNNANDGKNRVIYSAESNGMKRRRNFFTAAVQLKI
jgi:hypothetical protein